MRRCCILPVVSLSGTKPYWDRVLVRNKIVTRAELNDNLIHCLKGTTLAICLLDYRSIVAYLSVPGDNVKNIIRLGEKSNIVGLLFMAYEATFA